MSEGTKTVVINNLERALSTDINRLQTFKDTAIGELARYMFGVQNLNKELYPGYITEYAPGDLDPYQNSVVVNGLMPYPINGTTDLLISPGLAFMEDSTATSDQSGYRYVNDAGVTAVATLTLTTAPGAIRIDVIECQLTDTVTEQSSRDIFNPATGLFTPTLVDKVKQGTLNYRIREGAPGGGFPGVVTGWLPLAVVSVAAAALTWDDCEIWDVRPLLSASQNAPFIDWLQDINSPTFWSTAAWNAGLTQLLATGKVTNGIGPYNQSGLLGNHPTDAIWIDVASATNWASGEVPIASFPYYLWALTPFNLPGWRKYTGTALSPRRPTGMAGVMTVSMVGPTARGFPSLVVALPTATGLGGSTQMGSIAMCGWVDSGASVQSCVSDGDRVYLKDNTGVALPAATAPANGAGTSRYNFTDNLLYPACARAFRLLVERIYTGAAAHGYLIWTAFLVDTITGHRIATIDAGCEACVVTGGAGYAFITLDVPLFFNYALVGTRRVEIDITSAWDVVPTLTVEAATVTAWKMTP